MVQVLDSALYFGAQGFPIAVSREGSARTSSAWPDYTEIEHTHTFWELVIVLGGQGMHCLEGQSFPVSAGDVFVLQRQQKHYFYDMRGVELVNVLYDPKRLGMAESELRKLPGYCALFMLEPQHRKYHRFSSRLHLQRLELAHAEQVVHKIDSACGEREAGWEITALTFLQELIIYLSKCYASSDSTDAASLLRIANVIGLLENECDKPWSLDDLAKRAHMSRGNLIRVFRNATGETPIEYLISIQLQRAADLLRLTDHSITEIAFLVGFKDSNYFSRLFRKRMKVSPREFRIASL